MFPQVLDLALWKKPQHSGAVLAAATVVYFLFEKLKYTVLSLVCTLLLVFVLGCFAYTKFCGLTSRRATLRVCISLRSPVAAVPSPPASSPARPFP